MRFDFILMLKTVFFFFCNNFLFGISTRAYILIPCVSRGTSSKALEASARQCAGA